MNDENIEGLSDALNTDFESKDLPMRKQTEVNIVPLDSEKLEKDLTKDYANVRGNMKELIDQNVTVNNNTTNALYVGSTSDLQDLINQSRSSKKAFVDQDEVNDE